MDDGRMTPHDSEEKIRLDKRNFQRNDDNFVSDQMKLNQEEVN